MKLSILIVNWNSKDLLRPCLETIRETCADLSPQVVVVDGGSFDGSAEMVRDEFPGVDFVQARENVGFGCSNNLGFRRVEGDYVLLLNPDTELRPGAVQRLLAALEADPGAGLAGARLLNSDGSIQFFGIHHLPTPLNTAFDTNGRRERWWNERLEREKDGNPWQVEAVSGACMLLKSETFRKVGGFDPRYFMYAEDMDLCLKIRRMGLEILHVPDALVVHHGGGSSGGNFSRFSAVMIREALYTYFRLNHGLASAVVYRFTTGCSAAVRAMGSLVLSTAATGPKQERRKKAASKWGVVLGWALGREGWAVSYFTDAATTERSRAMDSNLPSSEPVDVLNGMFQSPEPESRPV